MAGTGVPPKSSGLRIDIGPLSSLLCLAVLVSAAMSAGAAEPSTALQPSQAPKSAPPRGGPGPAPPPGALPGRLPQLVPSPPGSVAAEGHTIVGTILRWQDRSGNEFGFEVEETTPGSSAASPLRRLPPNATSCSFVYDRRGEKRCYRVRAYNDLGASAYSPPACAETGRFVSLPPAPTDLRAVRVSGTQLNLEWHTTTVPYYIEGFTIEYRVEPATSPHWGTAAATWIESIRYPQGEVTLTNGAIYHSNGLVRYPFRGSAPDGRKHFYRVRAYNNAGASAWSNEATAGP